MGLHRVIRKRQFMVEFTFRGVPYRMTNRFGYTTKGVLVSEAVSEAGDITWSNEDGDFFVCPAGGGLPASIATIEAIWAE